MIEWTLWRRRRNSRKNGRKVKLINQIQPHLQLKTSKVRNFYRLWCSLFLALESSQRALWSDWNSFKNRQEKPSNLELTFGTVQWNQLPVFNCLILSKIWAFNLRVSKVFGPKRRWRDWAGNNKFIEFGKFENKAFAIVEKESQNWKLVNKFNETS